MTQEQPQLTPQQRAEKAMDGSDIVAPQQKYTSDYRTMLYDSDGFYEEGETGSRRLSSILEGSVVFITKSLMSSWIEGKKPTLFSTEAISDDSLVLNKMKKGEILHFRDMKDRHTVEERIPRTMYTLYCLSEKDIGYEGAEPFIVEVKGYSLSPDNENSVFSYMNVMRGIHGHLCFGKTKLEVKTVERGGQQIPYVSFYEAGALPPETHENIVKVQEDLRQQFDRDQERLENLVNKDDVDKNLKEAYDNMPTINPDDVPF